MAERVTVNVAIPMELFDVIEAEAYREKTMLEDAIILRLYAASYAGPMDKLTARGRLDAVRAREAREATEPRPLDVELVRGYLDGTIATPEVVADTLTDEENHPPVSEVVTLAGMSKPRATIRTGARGSNGGNGLSSATPQVNKAGRRRPNAAE